MNIDGAFPSNWLKAADIPMGRSVIVVINSVVMEDVSGDGETKPVLHFQGKDKGMVINRTNAEALKMLFGTGETDEWSGRSIRIVTMPTTYMGKPTRGLRIDLQNPPDQGSRQVEPEPESAPQEGGEGQGHSHPDDDIPF